MAGEDLKQELEAKTIELLNLTKDFEEFQETSKAFEDNVDHGQKG